MIGAILGDIIGSPYEFDRGNKTKNFPLFNENSRFTDDSVMTVAVAEALMNNIGKTDDEIKNALVNSMRKWGEIYPRAGYGSLFRLWLKDENPKPYGSFGNGSAMRVSSAGWLFNTLEETRHIARLTALVTHNHPEGIKGAEATASAIFLARNAHSKKEIKDYIIKEFGYNLSRTCDEIRPSYHHIETCQKTVPEAITAFMEGSDFEDVIRTAVSLGGDCDTLTCIAGGIAEAAYGVPENIVSEGRKRLPADMLAVIDCFSIGEIYLHGINVKNSMNHQQLLEILAQAWTNLDASELVKHIHQEFQYDSQKVLASMYADEYPSYITGKFNTIRKTGSKIEVSIVKDNYFGDGNMIKLVQDGNNVAYLRIKVKDGRIFKMDMCMF